MTEELYFLRDSCNGFFGDVVFKSLNLLNNFLAEKMRKTCEYELRDLEKELKNDEKKLKRKRQQYESSLSFDKNDLQRLKLLIEKAKQSDDESDWLKVYDEYSADIWPIDYPKRTDYDSVDFVVCKKDVQDIVKNYY